MGTSVNLGDGVDVRRVAAHRATPERVKIILVEWAAYPLYRNKAVATHTVRCGLGRMLDGLHRYDPGVVVGVTVVINAASEQSVDGPRLSCVEWPGGMRKPIEWMLRRGRERRLARRMKAYFALPRRYPLVEAVHFRDNQGQDFGAYDFGYQLLQRQGHEGDVLFMNSSVAGPFEHGWLLKYRDQFMRHPNVGLCGIGLNSHDTSVDDEPFAPHVQSYFLYTNMKVLEAAVGPRLFNVTAKDKREVIRQGEIGVSGRVLDAGYSITSPVFPEFAYRRGGTWSIPPGDLRFSRAHRFPVNSI